MHTGQLLESECLSLESQLQALQSAYDLWSELEEPGSGGEGELWIGEDEALTEKNLVESHYRALLDRVSDAKGVMDSELTR